MTTNKKYIAIIGGSYGGVSIAHYLLKHVISKIPEPDTYQVVLISAASQVMCRPATPRALISDDLFPQDKLFVSIPTLFEQYPEGLFRFIPGTARLLEHNKRSLSIDLRDGSDEKLEYYAIVIATGASTASPLLSLNKNEDSLRSTWEGFREVLPTAKSIIVAGGGPAGVETAGELGEHLNGHAGFFSSKIENPKVKITLVTSAPELLPVLRPSIAHSAEGLLAKVGVTVTKNARVSSVTPQDAGTESNLTSKATVTLENGETLEADLYIPAMGTKPNTGFIDSSLLAADGRVQTNSSTFRVENAGPRVYAVGDASNYARPAVHNILNAIPILAANIKRDLLLAIGTDETDAGADRIHKEDVRETQMVPIGKSKGVGAAMGYNLPSIMVWLIKGRDYWLWTTGNLWNGKQWAKET